MKLVIVESPTKAKTISQFIKDGYKIDSSYGHIRDLPKSRLGIDVENDFQPQYIIPRKIQKTVTYLKKEAAKAGEVILATDEDREGEAIAWHLAKALDLNNDGGKVKRIVFHEITKRAIEEALKIPRQIDIKLVNAQQARRVLDRLVGYKLSPFLWKKVKAGLSAGRVQSVALRLIVDRENEIRNFQSKEYWSISAILKTERSDAPQFESVLIKIDDKTIPRPGIETKEETDKIVSELKTSQFIVSKLTKKDVRKNPLPPLITSTLQQEAARRLGYSSKKTMFLAQRLYEKGLITYMRTDSVNLSQESLAQAREWIEKNLGADYAAASPRQFKSKSKLAQEAHEAVRPTDVSKKADALKLEAAENKIYDLIWRRFIASQLPQSKFSLTTAEIKAGRYILRSYGHHQVFDGFLKIWPIKFSEKTLPEIEENGGLELIGIKPEQHFTEPPPRYNEAALIKTLEEYGIGRPSTYAPIISVIQERHYVAKNEQRRFYPTEIGETVSKILTEHFPKVVDIQFTAKMEDEFDEIAHGNKEWPEVIKEFYGPFSKNLEEKYQSVEKEKPLVEETNLKCELCGKTMVIRYGRFGKFIACSGFPECKNTKALNHNEAKQSFGNCPKCAEGKIVRKRTRRGRFFYGCSKYPDCDYATWKLTDLKGAEKTTP